MPGSAAVDYNTIPAQFIERVDVLTGGASAVYGSDAVAGVVNIIYKKNFEGVAFDGQYGASAESDDQETQFGITFGTNTDDGRGNIMAHVGYTKQGSVMSARSRAFGRRPGLDGRRRHGCRRGACSTSRGRSIRASRRRDASSRPPASGSGHLVSPTTPPAT